MISATQKYLDRYAEKEIALTPMLGGSWNCAVVVPVYAEGALPERLLHSIQMAADRENRRTLVILVLNASINSSEENFKLNQESSELFERFGVFSIASSPPMAQSALSPWLDLIIVYRHQPPHLLGPKEGVGLARKIGCDLAVKLYAEGKLAQPWVRTTDADAQVELDYLATPTKSFRAGHFAYRHDTTDPSLPRNDRTATILYEIYLRYYVLGLQWAKSPYAFACIGSTLIFHADNYCQVRGFPNREAGEDFHFLNKLRKTTPIAQLGSQPITLKARRSRRVPFGTGAATIQISERLENRSVYLIYDPRLFVRLKKTLQGIEQWCHHPNDKNTTALENDPSLISIGIEQALRCAKQTRKNVSDRNRHLTEWFDSLRTLRYLHAVEKSEFPKIPWKRALKNAPFLEPTSYFESAEQWLNFLQLSSSKSDRNDLSKGLV